jgi:hypothetical protein
VVSVEDEVGNIFIYEEESSGIYKASIGGEYLQVGKSYSLHVTAPGGAEYRSDYDTMLACPPIDSLYFEQDERGTEDPQFPLHGLQFYLDMTGTRESASNFRWLIKETWEYTAPYYPEWVWYGGQDIVPVMDHPIFTCFITTPVKQLLSASTRKLTINSLKHRPLHFVSNETPRLKIQYSALVEQHSLTNSVYEYWETLESQSGGSGGLYETQPSSSTGNIYNVDDAGEKVLGCFYATQVQEKRLMFNALYDFPVPGYDCTLDTAQALGELGEDFPYYLFSLDPMGMGGPPYLYGGPECWDCRYYGGSTTPPDYWYE